MNISLITHQGNYVENQLRQVKELNLIFLFQLIIFIRTLIESSYPLNSTYVFKKFRLIKWNGHEKKQPQVQQLCFKLNAAYQKNKKKNDKEIFSTKFSVLILTETNFR